LGGSKINPVSTLLEDPSILKPIGNNKSNKKNGVNAKRKPFSFSGLGTPHEHPSTSREDHELQNQFDIYIDPLRITDQPKDTNTTPRSVVPSNYDQWGSRLLPSPIDLANPVSSYSIASEAPHIAV
jgi:hypothetical protein